MPLFKVMLSRGVIERADIEITADDENEARQVAEGMLESDQDPNANIAWYTVQDDMSVEEVTNTYKSTTGTA